MPLRQPIGLFRPSCRRLLRETVAQDLIEYGVLIALVAAVVIASITALGERVAAPYSATSDALPGGNPTSPQSGPADGNPGNGNPGNDKPVGNPGRGNPGKGGQ